MDELIYKNFFGKNVTFFEFLFCQTIEKLKSYPKW